MPKNILFIVVWVWTFIRRDVNSVLGLSRLIAQWFGPLGCIRLLSGKRFEASNPSGESSLVIANSAARADEGSSADAATDGGWVYGGRELINCGFIGSVLDTPVMMNYMKC